MGKTLQRLLTLILVKWISVCTSYKMCILSDDPTYSGILLDCSNIGISAADIIKLGSPSVSTLIISNNDIKTLQNNSFSHFPKLKRLECVSCNLNVLEADALQGLNGLEVLFLNSNSLKIADRAFPSGFYHHVPRLKILNIGKNQNHGYASNYSQFTDIFYSLHELSELTIDSFSNLRIGEEFAKLKNLTNLTVTCESHVTLNSESLRGFHISNVQKFALIGQRKIDYLKENCDMLFQYLPNISSLRVVGMGFGHRKFLKMLKPLRDRKLDNLYLDNIGLYTDRDINKEERIFDRIITDKDVQYLKYMCIADFAWLHNYLISFDLIELTSNTWKYCLRSITIVTGGTRLKVDQTYLFQFFRLKYLESLIYQLYLNENADEFWDKTHFKQMERSWNLGNGLIEMKHIVVLNHLESNNIKNNNQSAKVHRFDKSKALMTSADGNRYEERNSRYFRSTDGLWYQPHAFVRIPRFLKKLVIDDLYSFYFHEKLVFGENSVFSITMRNAIFGGNLKGQILGLNRTENIDFTNSRIRGAPSFFKGFPSLKKLVLRKTQVSSTYLVKVAENVPKLEYFDIAENDLEWMPMDMFRFNENLKYLCLASNRLAKIPFAPKLTRKLEILDLRRNFLILTSKERQSLDDHYNFNHVTKFTILLSNNHFSCACSAMHFLKWIQHSRLSFDKDKDYTCMTEEGSLSHISNYSDVESFWRHCSGQTYFSWSLVIFLALIVFYLTMFLIIMQRTQIISKIWQIMMPKKSKEHFTYDIVIGYATQDWRFIRNVLLSYLEDLWDLRVFVHQRDMLQDPLMMSHAIRDSWRTLLVITEDFLYHYEMAHNVMKVCTFFVNPTNPNSLIVIVEQNIQNRIPDYVLQVVDEDNIIVLPALPHAVLDYSTKETEDEDI